MYVTRTLRVQMYASYTVHKYTFTHTFHSPVLQSLMEGHWDSGMSHTSGSLATISSAQCQMGLG